ncbi:MAG: phenylalanine--tRNA ligase subunit beta [Rhodothalassiaceae bacterium]
MKFTLSWLRDHLATDASLDTLVDTLTRIGLEVEAVVDAAGLLAPFTVAEVIEAVPHPNADRLKLCRVRTAGGEVQVVCGAPNARTGMKAVFAPVGAHIPGTGITLKAARIRGVESRGMLCSEREMMLSDDHEGIIELDPDAPVGAPFAAVAGLDDPMIDIAVTPNRPDALGVAGIARDLAAAGLGRVKTPAVTPVEGAFACPIAVATEDESACPLFAGRLVRGVRNGPSPAWLRRRLEAIGLRPISALVDITNYLTHDRARPLHVYDAARLKGTVRARLAIAGERLRALDGRDYETRGGECLIADDEGPLGFGGVIGGEASGTSAETVDVFIESALFDPVRTAETGRAHGIESDARYRFERGVDPAFVIPGLERATRMVLDLCGGTPSRVVVAGREPAPPAAIVFDPARVKTLGGVDIPPARTRAILESLGFGWAEADGTVEVTPPSWRPDIAGPADLVEEVLRIHGYDAIPAVDLPRHQGVARATLTEGQRRARAVKRRLAAEGLDEAVTYSFMDARLARRFGAPETLAIANPISSELDMMRPSIVPNLLLAGGRNRDRGAESVALFEVGPAYHGTAPEDQLEVATALRMGARERRGWRTRGRAVVAYDAKADALAALAAAGAPLDKLQVAGGAPDWYHPGRSGSFRLGPKTVLAHFGELHPRLLADRDFRGPAVAAEVFLDRIPLPRRKATRARPALALSNLPAVSRDFAFLVDRDVRVGDLLRAVAAVDRTHITDVGLFDVYEGEGVEEGKKSVAITVRLSPVERTFTDSEIDAIATRIVEAAARSCGAELRR